MLLLAITSLIALAQGAGQECFYNDHLHYIYSLPDYSRNYTAVKEYWLRLDTECTLTEDTDSKITWYSSDIYIDFKMFWDMQDGQGCRALAPGPT